MNKATAFFTTTLRTRLYILATAALFLMILCAALPSYADTNIPPAYPGHGPVEACRSPYRGQDQWGNTVPKCASTGLSNKKWGGNYDDVSKMYERSVEDPCVDKGLNPRCSSNNAFNPQIRVKYRQCFGVPLPANADFSRWTCGGYELIGSVDLGPSECNFNAVNRFCARLTLPGSTNDSYGKNGNRTGIDPDYRTKNTAYSDPNGVLLKLTNGANITIASNKVTAYENHGVDDGDGVAANDALSNFGTGSFATFDIADEDGNYSGASITFKRVSASAGRGLLGGSYDYVVMTPRTQLCAFEDPGDMSDLAWNKWSPFQERTPKQSSAFSFLSNNGLSFDENMGVAAGASIGTAAALFVFMPAIAPAAVIIALIAIEESYYNLDVTTNLGCIDIALAPPPPPYPDALTSARPRPTVQAICAASQSPETTLCVKAKSGQNPSTFAVPRIRIGFDTLIPQCSAAEIPTYEQPCVTIANGDITSGVITAAGLTHFSNQLSSLTNANGESLSTASIRPSYAANTQNAGTAYVVNGILTGSYYDFDLSISQDSTYKDYRATNPPTDDVSTATVSTNLHNTVWNTLDSYGNSRTFFNCFSDNAQQVCGYELLDSSMNSSPASTLCSSTVIGNPNKALLLTSSSGSDCVDRFSAPTPTVAALATCTSNSATGCSSHTRPLMNVTIDGQTITLGTISQEYIDYIRSTNGQVNPLTGTLTGSYSECGYLGGLEFCAVAVDSAGDSYDEQSTPKSITEDVVAAGSAIPSYGYKRGGQKLCLLPPELIQANTSQVLATKLSETVDGFTRTYASLKSADRLVLNYTPGNQITYDSGAARTPATGDTTGTLLNTNEAVRPKKASEFNYCVNIPSPAYEPCPRAIDPVTNATWQSASASPSSSAPAIAGTCPAGTSGSPTRQCIQFYDSSTNRYYGSWGAVTGTCTRIACPAISYTNEGTATEPNPIATTDTNNQGNAKWARTNAPISGSTTVTGTCRNGRNGTVTRACNSDGTWGAVTGNCVLNRCSSNSVGRYCDFSATDIYTRQSDGSCGGTTHDQTRKKCCYGDMTWSGMYSSNVDCRSSYEKNGTNPTVVSE